MDFHKGDFVFHSRIGICHIEDIAPVAGLEEEGLFYVLRPIYGEDQGTILRVQVANSSCLSLPLSKKQCQDIMDHWPGKGDHYIKDSKARKTSYESALRNGDIAKLLPLLIGAYQRKAKDGHLNSMDGIFVMKSTPIVVGTLAHGLKREYDEILSLVTNK